MPSDFDIPFFKRCPKCPKAFKDEEIYKRHLRTQHGSEQVTLGEFMSRRSEARSHQDLLEIMEGQEIESIQYEGVVLVRDGKIIQGGKVIDAKPTDEEIKELWDELFYQEFGVWPTHKNLTKMMEEEFGAGALFNINLGLPQKPKDERTKTTFGMATAARHKKGKGWHGEHGRHSQAAEKGWRRRKARAR